MLIFKVMVCFLALFRSEDYVGGLPAIQDSTDNRRGELATVQVIVHPAPSNQGVTNEPNSGNRSAEILDYAEHREEELPQPLEKTSTPCVETAQVNRDGDQHLDGNSTSETTLEKISTPKNETSSSREDPKSEERENADMEVKKIAASMSLESIVNKLRKRDLTLNGENNSPPPEIETAEDQTPVKRERKSSIASVYAHQQSTNMRPTRAQHLVAKRRSRGEGAIGRILGADGNDKNFGKNSPSAAARSARTRQQFKNRRQYDTRDSKSRSSASNRRKTGGNQVAQFSPLNPSQINAAASLAYGNSGQEPRALHVDLSRALYQFGPSELHALTGVFDKVPPATKNFKPIAPEQVAYAPPRIVYETKIEPTPFVTEQKTVDALSALLGQTPAEQLQGLNLILGNEHVRDPSPTPSVAPEISRQDIRDSVALSQAFVTPIPPVDINHGIVDGSFEFPDQGQGFAPPGINANPFDHKNLEILINAGDGGDKGLGEGDSATIPIVEESQEGTQQNGGTDQGPTVENRPPIVWGGAARNVQLTQVTNADNENRGPYNHKNEEARNHGEGYAAKYNFGYHVRDYGSGNDFGHEEARDGVVTNGRYHVLLPDGRVQNVKYHVDEGGYHAKVSYQLSTPH
ncbi:uncharacterized protein LOC125501364 [Athalia rosae]|uniref:uncharacterized protein LOC125501364 n=1 Tax=Athalia rosae TaxID=37344 RepID=UPI002033AE60|nr:uncharacterized protein LOC125501364 [Athalia rosae]